MPVGSMSGLNARIVSIEQAQAEHCLYREICLIYIYIYF